MRGGMEKLRARLAVRDARLFESLKQKDPAFVPHAKLFSEVDGKGFITCANAGCKLRINSKRWLAKSSTCCPDLGFAANRVEGHKKTTEKRRVTMKEQVAARDLSIFAQQKRLNPSFVPHAKVHVECNDRLYYVCSNAGCKMRVAQSNWSTSRIQSCKGRASVAIAPVEMQVGIRERKRRSRRSGDPDVPI